MTCEVCFAASPCRESHCSHCNRARCCAECFRAWSLASGQRRCVVCRKDLARYLNPCELVRAALILCFVTCYYAYFFAFTLALLQSRQPDLGFST